MQIYTHAFAQRIMSQTQTHIHASCTNEIHMMHVGILPFCITPICIDQTKQFGLQIAEIGAGLIGFGISFSFLGVVLFFDRGLLALGNVSLLFIIYILTIICKMSLKFDDLPSDILVVGCGCITWLALYMATLH